MLNSVRTYVVIYIYYIHNAYISSRDDIDLYHMWYNTQVYAQNYQPQQPQGQVYNPNAQQTNAQQPAYNPNAPAYGV